MKTRRRLGEIEDVAERVRTGIGRAERTRPEVLLDELQNAAEIVFGVRDIPCLDHGEITSSGTRIPRLV